MFACDLFVLKMANSKVGLFLAFSVLVCSPAILGVNGAPAVSDMFHSVASFLKPIDDYPNFVISPFSILAVTSMAYAGARGDTKEQLKKVVDGEPVETPQVSEYPPGSGYTVEALLDVANRLFVHKELAENSHFTAFSKSLEVSHGAPAELMDFSDSEKAANKMNEFVSEKTRHHITDLIPSSAISEDTRLVLINALYFKAQWGKQFEKKRTHKDIFHARKGSDYTEKEVDFMRTSFDREPIFLHREENLTVVGLPYVHPSLMLFIIQPEDVVSFEKEMALNPQLTNSIVDKARNKHVEEEINLAMPKFKLLAHENRVDLESVFTTLGITDMFKRDAADFSGITGDKSLYVSSFLHQADIDVNEEGTEATAATAMMMMTMSMPMQKEVLNIKIDKPFIFQLRHATRTGYMEFEAAENDIVLFTGRIADI